MIKAGGPETPPACKPYLLLYCLYSTTLMHTWSMFRIWENSVFGSSLRSEVTRTAARYLQMATDQGNVAAFNKLGFLYENGKGPPRDMAAAAEWYRKAKKARQNPGTFLPTT